MGHEWEREFTIHIYPLKPAGDHRLKDEAMRRYFSEQVEVHGGELLRVWFTGPPEEHVYLVVRRPPDEAVMERVIESGGLKWASGFLAGRHPYPLELMGPGPNEDEWRQLIERILPATTPGGLGEWFTEWFTPRTDPQGPAVFKYSDERVPAYSCCGGILKHRKTCWYLQMLGGKGQEVKNDIAERLQLSIGASLATEDVSKVAAPLLAGFAFAFIGQVFQIFNAVRFADVTLALLTSAALSLLTAVQLGFNARLFYVPPSDLSSLLALAESDEHRRRLHDNQVELMDEYARRLPKVRVFYNLGIVLLLAALTAALIPPGSVRAISPWRGIAISLASLGCLTEIGWMVSSRVRRGNRRRGDRAILKAIDS